MQCFVRICEACSIETLLLWRADSTKLQTVVASFDSYLDPQKYQQLELESTNRASRQLQIQIQIQIQQKHTNTAPASTFHLDPQSTGSWKVQTDMTNHDTPTFFS